MFQSLGSSANSTKIKMYTLKLAVDWWTCYMLVNLDQRAQLVHHGLSCTTYRYFRNAVLSKFKKKKKITRLIDVLGTQCFLPSNLLYTDFYGG